ncbi:MAG: TatD family hydrolase [Elusimicrobiota bacterium]
MIDTHCHLLDSSFDSDRKEVIERVFSSGVTKLIEISIEPNLWQSSLDLCKQYKNIFCSIGFHPNDADKYVDFLHLLNDEKVVAIGECGLDYYRNNTDKKIQIAVFEKQLEIAVKFKKPVIIHCRSGLSAIGQSEEDVFNILSHQKNITGVIHCFSSTIEFAEKFLQLGFYIGIDGPITYPNAKTLREVVKKIPLEKILLETDSPYLPPQNFRGKRNEPSYIKYIAEKIAEIKNLPIFEISKITDENAKKLFGL